MRSRTAIVSAILLCGLARPAVSNGTIDIQTTAFDNFIVIDVTVVDNGGGGSCNNFFTLRRRALPECGTIDLATFARQPGTTSTHRFFDAPLQPSRAFEYEVVACSGFTLLFDCGWNLPISVCATTTPTPAYLGHGRLENGITFIGCPDLCATRDVQYLTPDAWQYVGTGTEVLIYGSFFASCQNGWLYYVSQVVPSRCTVPVDACTWSRAKTLFR